MEPVLFILIGLAAMAPLVVQVVRVSRTTWRRRHWIATTAEVIGIDTDVTRTDNGDITGHTLRWAYADADGRTRTGRGKVPQGRLAIGAPLEVLVDPRKPERSQPARGWGWIEVMIGVLSCLVFAVGLLAVVQGSLQLFGLSLWD